MSGGVKNAGKHNQMRMSRDSYACLCGTTTTTKCDGPCGGVCCTRCRIVLYHKSVNPHFIQGVKAAGVKTQCIEGPLPGVLGKRRIWVVCSDCWEEL